MGGERPGTKRKVFKKTKKSERKGDSKEIHRKFVNICEGRGKKRELRDRRHKKKYLRQCGRKSVHRKIDIKIHRKIDRQRERERERCVCLCV